MLENTEVTIPQPIPQRTETRHSTQQHAPPQKPCPVCGKTRGCPGVAACMETNMVRYARHKGKVICPLCGLYVPGPEFARHAGRCLNDWERRGEPDTSRIRPHYGATTQSVTPAKSRAHEGVQRQRQESLASNPTSSQGATSIGSDLVDRRRQYAQLGEIVYTAARAGGQRGEIGKLAAALALVLDLNNQ